MEIPLTSLDWENAAATPELLEYYRSHIGVEYQSHGWLTEASIDSIRHYAEGVGDDNPLFLDAAYAGASRFGGIIAPATFPTVFSNKGGQADDGFHGGPIKGLFGLWAGDRWQFIEPVRLGDRVTATFSLVSLRERPSRFGKTAFETVEEIRYHDAQGRRLSTYQTVRFNYERAAARQQAKYADIKPYRYSDAEIEAIQQAYEEEAGRRRGAAPRYWEDVAQGDELPPLVKGPLTLTQLIGFVLGWGSAYCMTNRLAYQFHQANPEAVLINREFNIPDNIEGAHWDLSLAQQSGFPYTYDFGCMRTAWCSHLLTDWSGDDGWVKELDVQIRRPGIIGDTQWVHGRVTGKRRDGGDAVVDVELWAVNQRGETTTVGSAVVALPTAGGSATG
ncbi:MAG: MaoC family dehydratase N-terminal domain-containing protein [Chloroflexi bacterium]|nr:MaoC family dehydratase N-terminal domain-containing protein [Chloroflexota bacterium]